MRDPKTLRTLILLDLETHPPDAPIERVRVSRSSRRRRASCSGRCSSARSLARAGLDVARASDRADGRRPRRLAAAGRFVEAGRVCDDRVSKCQPKRRRPQLNQLAASELCNSALCTSPGSGCPIPTRVQVQEGRPIRITTDRHGFTSGAIVQAAGPWRTSGEWWNEVRGRQEAYPPPPTARPLGPRRMGRGDGRRHRLPPRRRTRRRAVVPRGRVD